MTNALSQLAVEIAALKRRLDSRNAPQLANSSIVEGAVTSYDADETLRLSVGEQFDGTHVSAALVGPVPPVPSTPVLTATPGGLTVHWKGTFVNDAGVEDIMVVAPQDFLRVEIHVNQGNADFNSDSASTLVGTFETPRGGDYDVRLPIAAHSVVLRTRAQTGKISVPSARAVATPGLVTGDLIAASATVKQLILTSTTDVNLSATNAPPLRIGDINGNHLRMDGDELISMKSPTQRGPLGIQGRFFTGWGWGVPTVNPDSAGNVRVAHGLTVVPAMVQVTSMVEGVEVVARDYTATDFGLGANYVRDGSPYSAAFQISWFAIG